MTPSREEAQNQVAAMKRWSITYAKQIEILNQMNHRRASSPSAHKIKIVSNMNIRI